MKGSIARKGVSRRGFALAGAVAWTGAGVVRSAGAAQLSWKIGYTPAANHPLSVRIVEACAAIRKETNGEVAIAAFPNSALGGADASMAQLRLGALEMMAQSAGALTVTPLGTSVGTAYVFADRPTVFRALDGDFGALVRSEFPSKGFVALEKIYENGFRNFTTSTKPIRVASDLQGVKLRVVPSKLALDTFRSLGASVTGIEARELYVALQTHIVEAQETALALIETSRFFEVQKYLSLSRHVWDGFWIIINRDKWESLPRERQEVMRKHFNAGALLQRRDIGIQERSLTDLLHRQGLAVNQVDAATFKAKLASTGYYARWREEFGPAAWTAIEKYTGSVG